jgi:hypothetical protein
MSPFEVMQIFSILGSLIAIIVVLIVLILLGRINHHAYHILQELRRKDETPVDLRVKCYACGEPIARGSIQHIKNDPVCPICYAKVKNKPVPESTTA